MNSILLDLFSMQDPSYKKFQEKLIPTVDPNLVIGVRTPQLRNYAKCLYRTECAEIFLHSLPHLYYEENNLHGFLIEQIKDYSSCILELNAFLPFVDNWATCDMLRPKCFNRHREELVLEIEKWIVSNSVYTVRFAIGMLLTHYLDQDFDKRFLDLVATVKSEAYYINMMVAWYFATALAKQYDDAVLYLQNRCLPAWTHQKTIQKAVESFRILPEQKAYLRTLRIK